MVESAKILEMMVQEAKELMLNNKHLDSERKLSEIDDAADFGSLTD